MSDIKSVLSLLCHHLNSSINIALKPEHFRLAKFNNSTENVIEIFWQVLNVLSYHAVKEKQIEIDFQQYDLNLDVTRSTKLYFAYLQYTTVEFYALSRESKDSRQLLLAFAWLLGTHNVLKIIVRANVASSILGRECSCSTDFERKETSYDIPESLNAQINNILYLNGKVNYNLKDISELVSEKAKLASKAHAASIGISGLPHLSISELALIKRMSTINKKELSNEDRKYLKDMSTMGSLLDTYMKWLTKEHIFFEWMVTVVEEHNKSLASSLNDLDWNEVSKFIFLLRELSQERFESLSSRKESATSRDDLPSCVSRLLRVPNKKNVELEDRLKELSTEVNKNVEDLSRKKEELSQKLKEILRSIPSSVQVSF